MAAAIMRAIITIVIITLIFTLDQVYVGGSLMWQSQNPEMRKPSPPL